MWIFFAIVMLLVFLEIGSQGGVSDSAGISDAAAAGISDAAAGALEQVGG